MRLGAAQAWAGEPLVPLEMAEMAWGSVGVASIASFLRFWAFAPSKNPSWAPHGRRSGRRPIQDLLEASKEHLDALAALPRSLKRAGAGQRAGHLDQKDELETEASALVIELDLEEEQIRIALGER